jgi:hypothetical protein
MGFQRFLVSLYSIKRIPGIGVITITRMYLKSKPSSPVIGTSVNVTEWNVGACPAAKMAQGN